jgi:hypothetical protein
MRLLRAQLLLLATAFAVCGSPAGSLRTALLAEVEVQGDTIVLADLCPSDAPRAIRAEAESVALGSAPRGGSIRRLSRGNVATAIRNAGLPISSFSVPEVITVHRAGRLVTREDAFAAIQAALAKNHDAQLPQFRLDDLTLDSAVAVPAGASDLEVTQISFDEALGRARFRLWPHSAPGTLPFFVTAHLPESTSRAAGATTVAKARDSFTTVEPVLVDPRQYARLHLHSQNSDMLLAVKPLQRGHLGETIRVRLTGSGKTLQARVIASGYLDATF